jgi:hypothetical protein
MNETMNEEMNADTDDTKNSADKQTTEATGVHSYIELLQCGVQDYTEHSVIDVRRETLSSIDPMELRSIASKVDDVSGKPGDHHADRLAEEGCFMGPVGDTNIYQYNGESVEVAVGGKQTPGLGVEDDWMKPNNKVYIDLLEQVINDSEMISVDTLCHMTLSSLVYSELQEVADIVGHDPVNDVIAELSELRVFSGFYTEINVFQYDEETGYVETIWKSNGDIK